jgi:hypothetical protein
VFKFLIASAVGGSGRFTATVSIRERQVFRSLLRLQAAHPDRSSRGKETMTKWLHEVDYLAKGLIAGKQPTESQLNDAFVG